MSSFSVGTKLKFRLGGEWILIGEVVETSDGRITAIPRDEYHTMDELYEYRMLYNAHAANLWAKYGVCPVVKSWKHSDGKLCFGGGYFVVVAQLPLGQVSNHYKALYWDLFNVPEVDIPPEYDGHTPEEASERLTSALLD